MYLWKVDSLVKDFRAGMVSQKEEYKYVLLSTIATVLVSDPIFHIGLSYNYYDAITSVLFVGISIFGVYYCYQINSAGDDKDFIIRIMCIGLPVAIRLLAVGIPIFIIVKTQATNILYPEPLGEASFESAPIDVVLSSLFIAAYYWYLSVKIKAVSYRAP